MHHVLEWVRIVPVLLFGTRYNWWDPKMSHADVLVCNGDQQQEGIFFQNREGSSCVDLLAMY